MQRSPLDAADSAWLRVDRDHNHMIITALMVLDRPVPFETLCERFDERLRRYPRLMRRIARGPFGVGPPCWEDDADFGITQQFERNELADPAGRSELETFIGTLMQAGFPDDRPHWRIHYVERFASEHGGEGAAIVIRVHHCMADGIALLRVLLSLADEPPQITFPTAAAGWARSARERRPLARTLAATRLVARSAASFVGFLTSRGDPHSRFRRPLGSTKCAALSKPLPLSDIKDIARAHGATVNEVLLCAAAGALRHVLENDPGFHEALVLRGVVPVNLRADEDLENLGNRFGLVFMPMPVGMSDRGARLRSVRKAMTGIKSTPEALAWFAVLRALGRVPDWIEALGVELFSRKATLVVTSLAGPTDALHLCGAKLEDLMFWVPSAGQVGLGLSMLSYDDRVLLGVATDAGQLDTPARIARAFEEEIRALSGVSNQVRQAAESVAGR
ncbi:MAG: DUF1298 domain-containing protein [bacterium]|nr:DUF1298 domain-containing protein [bacterium]